MMVMVMMVIFMFIVMGAGAEGMHHGMANRRHK